MGNFIVKVEGKIGTIIFNKPEVGNAFDTEMFIELRELLEGFNKDSNVKVVVLTGAGKLFNSGGDIKTFKKLIDEKVYLTDELVGAAAKASYTIRHLSKPVIAMVNGAAAGAEASLALACDFRVMDVNSKMVMAFISMGTSGDSGGFYYLNRMVGVAKATELMMLGEVLSAEECYRLSLCNRLAEEGALEEETYKLARTLAKKPSLALKRQKELINDYFFKDLVEYMEDEKEKNDSLWKDKGPLRSSNGIFRKEKTRIYRRIKIFKGNPKGLSFFTSSAKMVSEILSSINNNSTWFLQFH